MTEQQIVQMVKHGKLPGDPVNRELKETHISWIVLCNHYVYKIKKPLKLSFLDFSSLEKRKYYCEMEVALNQRLTQDIYLKVCPIWHCQGIYNMTSDRGEIVDYAVVMKRLDNSREMSKLLPSGQVTATDIEKIARQLIHFHKNAQVIKGILTPELLIEDFNDILQVESFISKNLGKQASGTLQKIVLFAEGFINKKASLVQQRDREGFTRDCHGDLHSGNIFLLDDPVIFDCIEFNEHLRRIDILAELGFFCMDLEFYLCHNLSKYFMDCYLQGFEVIRNEAEEQLFLFYKMYRANVKVKVNALKTEQAHNEAEKQSRLVLFKQYYQLLLEYYRSLV